MIKSSPTIETLLSISLSQPSFELKLFERKFKLKIFQGVDIPPQNEIYRDLTSFDTYRFKPEKSPDIPVKLGERSQYLLLLSKYFISFCSSRM